MNTDNSYSVSDLVTFVIKEYQLPTEPDEEIARKTYRQQISRTFQKMELWENAKTNTVGKKKIKYFTEKEKQQLLEEKSFYNYLRERSQSKEIRNSKRYDEYYKEMIKEIELRRQQCIAFYDSLSEQDNNISDSLPDISNSELRSIQNHMMLKALFEKFFTPINKTLLYNDLYQVNILKDETALEFEDIEAEKRLAHPEGNYYKPRD